MFIQYKDVSKATRPAFAQYRPDSLLVLWTADMPCCVWEVPCTVQSVYSSSPYKRQEIKVRVLFEKRYRQQTYKIVLIKTPPGILSFNTFFSGIPKCYICFTRSLFTEAIQAHTAPSFPPPFLTKYILHIPPRLSSQLFFINLYFITSCNSTTSQHTQYTDAVTKQFFQGSFLHIRQLWSLIIKQWS